MKIGVAYYPEHWPKERWPVDARLMRQLQIDVARVGEFAWSRLEPKRETFDTDWLAEAIEALAGEGLRVILCTPTAAPPPWLFNRHPGIVPVDSEGRRWHMGSRRDACLNSPPFQKYARRIVAELARRFAGDRNIHAWQIDNELGCGPTGRCYCDDCQQAFRRWLKGRYGSVDRLNRQWGTAFWSQEFTDWHEIPAPRRTTDGVHPSLALDYSRFVSATYRAFVHEQAETIRQSGGEGQTITTNSIGLWLDQIDQFSLARTQSLASVDNYPVDDSRLNDTALNLDLTRSLKRLPFWVLEQQAGATMIRGKHLQPRPGQLKLWSFQAAARGAELISYFRWKTCSFGQEMHWYGLLDADGTPRRRYEEIRDTIIMLKGKAPLWEGSLPDAQVAIALDYQSHWALAADDMSSGLGYVKELRTLYGLLREMGAQVDFLEPQGDVEKYRLLILPMPVICPGEVARQVEVFIVNGGTLLVTAPAGYRTAVNGALMEPPPGRLSELLAIEVVEHDAGDSEAHNTIVFDDGKAFPVGPFCSVVELRGARAIASYQRDFYKGSAAVTANAKGDGSAFFLGAASSRECYRHLLDMVLQQAGVERMSWSSESVEVVPLEGVPGQPRLTFALNHSADAIELPLPERRPYEDLLTDQTHTGVLRLEGYGVALLKM